MERFPEPTRSTLLRRADWLSPARRQAPPRTFCAAGPALTEAAAIAGVWSLGRGRLRGRGAAEPGRGPACSLPGPPWARAGAYTSMGPPAAGRRRRCAPLQATGFEPIGMLLALAAGRPTPGLAAPGCAGQAIEYFSCANARPTRAYWPATRLGLRRIGGLRDSSPGYRGPMCAVRPSRRAPRRLRGARSRSGPVGREAGLGEPPGRLAWLLLTDGTRSENKVIALVFATAREPQPRLAVKMARLGPTAADCAAGRGRAPGQGSRTQRPARRAGAVFAGEAAGRSMLAQTALERAGAVRPPWAVRPCAPGTEEPPPGLGGWPRTAAPAPRAEWWPRLAERLLQGFEQQLSANWPRRRC